MRLTNKKNNKFIGDFVRKGRGKINEEEKVIFHIHLKERERKKGA
jgi:hypothetical protein